MADTPIGPRCYTAAQICEFLQMPISTFRNLKTQGKLPFLEELRPRLGMHARYRADLVDAYLRGEWRGPTFVAPRRFFGRGKDAKAKRGIG
jgi:hypothetical protein